MIWKRRVLIAITGAILCLIATPFLCLGMFALGANHFGWEDRVEETDDFSLTVTSESIHEVWFGPMRLTGEAVWAVPLMAGSGGLLGGMGLLIWSWRSRSAEANVASRDRQGAGRSLGFDDADSAADADADPRPTP